MLATVDEASKSRKESFWDVEFSKQIPDCERILEVGGNEIEKSGFLVSDARHYDLLLRTQNEIENSLNLLENKMSEEIILIGLHNAIRYLGEITGETTTEDMLTRIFSTFCIGK